MDRKITDDKNGSHAGRRVPALDENQHYNNDTASRLDRRLTLFDTTFLVIGGIIGTGIFFNTSYVAQWVESPRLILLTWVGGGVIALAGALCFAELSRMIPDVGGEYAFLREGWHPLIAFLYGWTVLLVISSGLWRRRQ